MILLYQGHIIQCFIWLKPAFFQKDFHFQNTRELYLDLISILLKQELLIIDIMRMIRYAFEQRNIGDYKFLQRISIESAQKVINDAADFLKVTKEYLEGSE